MNNVFWLVTPIESLPTLGALLDHDGSTEPHIPKFWFEVGRRVNNIIVSGGREEYDFTGRYIDSQNRQPEWTKSLEFNNGFVNLHTYIQRVPGHIAQHIALPFNSLFNEKGFAMVTVNGRWCIVELHNVLDDELVRETYYFNKYGVVYGEQADQSD